MEKEEPLTVAVRDTDGLKNNGAFLGPVHNNPVTLKVISFQILQRV